MDAHAAAKRACVIYAFETKPLGIKTLMKIELNLWALSFVRSMAGEMFGYRSQERVRNDVDYRTFFFTSCWGSSGVNDTSLLH